MRIEYRSSQCAQSNCRTAQRGACKYRGSSSKRARHGAVQLPRLAVQEVPGGAFAIGVSRGSEQCILRAHQPGVAASNHSRLLLLLRAASVRRRLVQACRRHQTAGDARRHHRRVRRQALLRDGSLRRRRAAGDSRVRAAVDLLGTVPEE